VSIAASIEIILQEYSNAARATFKNNPVAAFLRDDFPEQVRTLIGPDERFRVKGSAGASVWAKVPWLAVMDVTITTTPQDGYYVVYLFKEDLTGVYLSLNQGVTIVKHQYGADAKSALRAKANDYAAQLGDSINGLISGKIDLATSAQSGLGASYECGNICARYYDRYRLPSDLQLGEELKRFLNLYRQLSTRNFGMTQAAREPDEVELGLEDLINLREHKRIERNAALARRAKTIHGFICQACGFDFAREYGEIGKDFIEAHHLTPLSQLKGLTVTLNPRKDFCVLCSNCHRMIHKSVDVGDLGGFVRDHLDGRVPSPENRT